MSLVFAVYMRVRKRGVIFGGNILIGCCLGANKPSCVVDTWYNIFQTL